MGSLLRILGIVLSTLVFSVLTVVALPIGIPALTWVARNWSRVNLMVCGVRVVQEGWDPALLERNSYVAMANHISHFDVMALYGYVPLPMRPIAKRELVYIPVFGWVLWAGAAIMIDRRNRKKASQSLRRAAQVIRDGSSVLMFPEGTRTPEGQMGALKKGAFHLALEAQVPVLPIGVEGTGAILPPHDWRIRPGTVHVRVGKPIETTGLQNNDDGRRALMGQVEGALAELSRQSKSATPA
ncbi:MAG: lysophospholipid acyltransferase family protein [Myxococcota bacterium]